MSKKRMPGYVALVLDQDTQEDVRNWASLPNLHATHVTMAFRPTREVYDRYTPLIGKTIEFRITGFCHSDAVEALVVEGVPSENVVPHITVATAEGVPPSRSNEALASFKPDPEFETLYDDGFRGRGTVKFIRYF